MVEFFNLIENTLEKYPQIIQMGSWIAGFATLVVSVISIWLAYRALFSRISAYVDVKRLYENYDDIITIGTPFKKCLVLTLINHGPNTIFIEKHSGFAIKIPLTKHGYDVVNLDISNNKKNILPGNSETFRLTKDQTPEDFFDNYFKCLLELAKKKENNIRLILPKIVFRYMKFYVQTSDGRFIKAKTSKNLQGIIHKSIKDIKR